MTPAELRLEAEVLVRAGGAVLKDRFCEVRTIDFKGPGRGNLVTDADRAAEALIIDALRRTFPEHGLLTEESGTVSTGDLRWILDPLDGTTNYAHGVPHFCVSLAAEGPWNGGRRVLAAATFDPLRDELFSAARGQGATLNGRRLQASSESALDRALLCTGFPYDVQLNPDAPLGLFDRLVRQARGMRRMGSAALELAWVAAGRFDGFFEFGLKPWDVAAGALLIEEAGGSIACLDGSPWDARCGDVVAAGPGLFGQLVGQCRDFVATQGVVLEPFDSTRRA
ncbi:MAG: inositol monophosphatase family protein [Myxococcales bacterium]|nr:inositol monophosphatase family protein [Myxococcales bacterium]